MYLARLTIVALCLLPGLMLGQVFKGTVSCQGEPVQFANIIPDAGEAQVTDENGKFQVIVDGRESIRVSVSAMGYITEIVSLQTRKETSIELDKVSFAIDEVVVTGTMREMSVLSSPVKTEVATAELLNSIPSYNLVESVNLINGVQEVVACGVCGTNDIHINGMEGAYTLVLIDGMPIMSSLASVYGFNGIPTSMIRQVEIIKGPSSTLYGTEAVGGVINIITKNPDELAPFSLATSYSTHDELNIDAAATFNLGQRAQTMLSVNGFRNDKRLDVNEDNFTDIPLSERISVFSKTNFKRNHGRKAGLAFRYFDEDRSGGVLDWTPEYTGSDSIYGEFIATQRYELFGNYQIPVPFDLSIEGSATRHEQASFYGDTEFNATQDVYFANLLSHIETGNHFITLGSSQRIIDYEDNTLAASDELRYIPGVFAQDEWQLSKATTLLIGARIDRHEAHGWTVSPRINLKQNLGEFTTLRLNAGNGFRVVNLFTEDHAALTGARQVLIGENLDPEESWNTTLNLNKVYSTRALGYGAFDLDLFHTWFSNKIIPDYDTDPNLIIYENLQGRGISRGVSASLNHTIKEGIQCMIGFTYLDVFERITEGNEEIIEQQLLTPNWSVKSKLSWSDPEEVWTVNYVNSIMGPMHLPTYDDEFARDEISDVFSLHHIKIERQFNQVSLMAGIKNLLDYMQESPLVDPANPFGDSFDTAYAYGPLQARRFVFGIEWRLSPSQNQ